VRSTAFSAITPQLSRLAREDAAVAKGKTTLESLTRIARAQRNLGNQAKQLAEVERRTVGEVRGLLAKIGYDLVAMDDRGSAKRQTPRRHARGILPKILKCPKCDRRFSLQMHVARHLSAMHKPEKPTHRRARPRWKRQSK
jgi:uncharacterized C2H2 Zn-finger protein